MATASVTFTFAPGALIKASEANQNFTDVENFLNGSVMHRDGSLASTAVLSGPSSDPVSANQYARKAYVDKIKPIARQILTSNGAVLGAGPVDTDFLLSSVVVAADRAYEVSLHGRVSFSATSEWAFHFTVDGSVTDRLDHRNVVGSDSQQLAAGTVLWLPTAGTKTLRVSVERISGGGTVQFLAGATVQRMFYVKDVGLR